MEIDPWHLSTLLGVLATAIVLVWQWELNPWVKIAYGYLLVYGIASAFLVKMGMSGTPELVVHLGAAKFCVVFILLPLFFEQATRGMWWHFQTWVLAALLLDSIGVMTGGQGIFIGNTQSALVCAIFLPLFVQHRFLCVLAPLCVVPTFYTQSISGYVALSIHLTMWLYQRRKIYALYGVMIGASAFYYLPGTDQIFPRTRIVQMWLPNFKWWVLYANHWVGTGPMSYEWLSAFGNMGTPRMWMHSDWLQILFETGYLGLSAAVFLAGYGVWYCRKKAFSMSTLLALYAGMLVYSPMQFFIVWFLTLNVIKNNSRELLTRN